MSDAPTPQATGRQVYQELLALRKQKPVYVLASHSHFFMEGIFNTPYLKEHEEVLPGWIIGTAGAVRYKLPDDAKDATAAREHVYGYLLAKVSSRGKNDRDPIRFEFHEVGRGDVPAEVVQRFSSGLVDTVLYRQSESTEVLPEGLPSMQLQNCRGPFLHVFSD